MADQLADAEIQEDLLKHPDQSLSVEDMIKFVEVRAAGKRSALTMSTPTTTSSIEYEDEDSAAITSAYRKQQRRPAPRSVQDPSKVTSNRLRANPTSQQRPTNSNPTQKATPAKGNNHHGRPTTNGRGPCAYCGQGNKREPPTAGSTAPHLAPLAPPVAGQTTWPTCAGSKSNTNHLYPSRYTQCMRGHSSIRPGTKPPTHGARDAHHHSPTSQSLSPQGRKTSGLTDTHWHVRPTTSPPLPWLTQGVKAASPASH